jgi:uncharacterized protein (DUF305 family)
MAGWAPSHGASPSIRTLCERIINGQQDEIATMQRWLKDRGLPVPDATPMKMDMGSMNHEMLMPGMLTDEQMKDLDQARGPEFDRKFLTYMIQHHRGAITMVQQLFATKGAAQDEATSRWPMISAPIRPPRSTGCSGCLPPCRRPETSETCRT